MKMNNNSKLKNIDKSAYIIFIMQQIAALKEQRGNNYISLLTTAEISVIENMYMAACNFAVLDTLSEDQKLVALDRINFLVGTHAFTAADYRKCAEFYNDLRNYQSINKTTEENSNHYNRAIRLA